MSAAGGTVDCLVKVSPAAVDLTNRSVFALMTAAFVQVLDSHLPSKSRTNRSVESLGEDIRALPGLHLQSGGEQHPSAAPGTCICS